ncbi:hypothetical protein, partial [Xanthovirga aplysinae]|uniref:hypothetical protein n=1 Tax=Xanthovirga aplysinae TaxID=2529853 RepID=UPI0012BB67FB
MLQKPVNLYDVPYNVLFQEVKHRYPNYKYDFKKHLIILNDENRKALGHIRLPLHLSINDQLTITNEETLVVYLSIESGNAALCVKKGKHNLYHTTFSAYMTRKKQGVSQIKYLNKKGKSRAGSRVRLAATIDFFERINTTLLGIFEKHEIQRIALNCNTTLIPYLHQSKIACPFDKQDPRLYKIPLHIPQS